MAKKSEATEHTGERPAAKPRIFEASLRAEAAS